MFLILPQGTNVHTLPTISSGSIKLDQPTVAQFVEQARVTDYFRVELKEKKDGYRFGPYERITYVYVKGDPKDFQQYNTFDDAKKSLNP